MSTNDLLDDQDERSRELYEPEWYDSTLKDIHNLPESGKSDDLEKNWDADNSGYNPDDPNSKAKPNKADSPDQIANQEDGIDTSAGQTGVAAPQEENLAQAADTLGKGFTGGKKGGGIMSRIKSNVTTRRAAIGGAVAVPLVSIAFFALVSAPQLIVSNLRSYILERTSQLQTSQSVRYRRSKISKVSDLFSKDGRIGGRMITDMERRGYKFTYESDGRTVRGLTLPNGRSTLLKESIGDHISDYMEVRHPLRTSRWKTKRTNALYARYGIQRTSIVRPTGEPITDPDRATNKAVAENVLDDGTGYNEDVRVTDPADDSDAAQAEYEQDQGIVRDFEGETEAATARNELIQTGADIEDLTSVSREFKDAIDEIPLGVGENVTKLVEEAAKGNTLGKIGNTIKGFLNPTEILDKICTLKNRLRTSVSLGRSTRSLAMLRNAGLFVGVADSARTNDVDPKLFNSIMKRVTANDRNGNPIGASPGISYALKGRFNKNSNAAQKSQYGVDGKPSGVIGGVQEATYGIPGTGRTACGIVQNPLVQIGSAVVVNFGKAALCAVSLGTGCAASQAVDSGVRLTITQSIKTAVSNSVRQIFTRATVRNLALTAAAELSFEGILIMTQLYIEQMMALPITTQESGAELGNILMAGGGVANKQRSLAAGMVPATAEQYAMAEQQYLAEKEENFKNLSFAERYFSTQNTDSMLNKLAGSAVLSAPSGTSGASSLPGYAMKFFDNAFSLNPVKQMANTLSGGKAYAADEDEVSFDVYQVERGADSNKRLATDFAGNLQPIMRSDIEQIDPVINIEELKASGDIDPTTLEPASNNFKQHVKNCVEIIDTLSVIEFGVDGEYTDCLANERLTVKFKAHLAYLDMLDGLEAAALPEEIDAAGSSTQPTTPTTPSTPNTGASAQYIPDCTVNGGVARIACTAIDQMLNIPYGNGYSNTAGCRHSPAGTRSLNPAYLDCSAFTSMAVYRTFGYEAPRSSVAYLRDPNFSVVGDTRGCRASGDSNCSAAGDIRSIQPGDLIGRGSTASGAGGNGHIGIVVSYDRTTNELVTVETDSCGKASRIVTDKGLAVDGRGSYEWAVRYIGPQGSPGAQQ